MRFKVGVKMPRILDPRMIVAFDAIEYAWADLAWVEGEEIDEPTITSWADGEHRVGSYHKVQGRAVDVRTKNIPRSLVVGFVSDVAKRISHLGFDVILEDFNGPSEHMHLELDSRADIR
jgi:hypothetical protein